MATSPEENWAAAINPRHLLRLSRVRPSGRKYLLLACAAVRHLVPGPRTELGERVLTALERYAAARPTKAAPAHVWNEVLRGQIPELPELPPFDWDFGADTAWLRQFAYRLGTVSQVHTAEVNVIFELGFAPVRSTAARDAHHDARALAAQIVFGSPVAPAGWFERQLRQVNPPDVKSRIDGGKFRDAVLARLPAAKRARAELDWPSGAGGFSPWQRGLSYLTTEREEARFAEANARACELTREVFGNPFAPPHIDPDWLAWNHGAVRSVADQIAASGDFSQLPILGDALEEAGCQHQELLAHCRKEGGHVPGCWALEAVLGL